ncbi:MAG: helix-turn-helix transcriptional regulator [Clostridiales bacterium]|nr:helix-turn-helix transcriptional regulator [Clostridiales bacterium]
MEKFCMTLNQAFAQRVRQLLKEKKMTMYRLEQDTGLYHSTISCLMNGRYKTANFRTMALIIRALGVSVSEFFNDPIFEFDDLDID